VSELQHAKVWEECADGVEMLQVAGIHQAQVSEAVAGGACAEERRRMQGASLHGECVQLVDVLERFRRAPAEVNHQ
jgi:hypothetical protein